MGKPNGGRFIGEPKGCSIDEPKACSVGETKVCSTGEPIEVYKGDEGSLVYDLNSQIR